MKQEIIQLPETTEIKPSRGYTLLIKNHEVVNPSGLFEWITIVIGNNIWKNTVKQMQDKAVSFEAVIEWCITELEERPVILSEIIWYFFKISYNTNEPDKMVLQWNKNREFSKSEAGRVIADQFIEKLRDCHNWDELGTEMNLQSRFNIDMKQQMKKRIEGWHKT